MADPTAMQDAPHSLETHKELYANSYQETADCYLIGCNGGGGSEWHPHPRVHGGGEARIRSLALDCRNRSRSGWSPSDLERCPRDTASVSRQSKDGKSKHWQLRPSWAQWPGGLHADFIRGRLPDHQSMLLPVLTSPCDPASLFPAPRRFDCRSTPSSTISRFAFGSAGNPCPNHNNNTARPSDPVTR